MISIVIPTFNEEKSIGSTLCNLTKVTNSKYEVIVVDGYSFDDTRKIVRNYDRVKLLMTEKGRANQMNHGAKEAKYKYILFLHADTLLNPSSLDSLIVEIESKNVLWGWFPIRLNNSRLIYRIIELFANLRAKITGTPLGDHAIFVRKDIFEKVGGYPDIPIMEDLELVNKIKNINKGMRVKSPVITSVRRFENSGILRTFLKMWTLRILYSLGISTQTLVRYYGDIR